MGNVATLISHLIALRVEQRTGVLAVRCGEVGTSIMLRAGEIVFAEEDAQAETLGLLLVRQSKLTQTQYEHVIARMAGGPEARDAAAAGQLRFGELAVELGMLTTPVVVKALGDQVRFRVMRIFQRRDELSWQFSPHMESEMGFASGTPGAALRAAVGSAPPSIEELVLDAVRWIDDDHKNELGLFMVLGQKLGVRAEDRPSIAARFALGREETEFLAKLDGKLSIGAVLSMSGAVDGPAVLTALLLTNVLGVADAEAPARAADTPIVITPIARPASPAASPAAAPAQPRVPVTPTPLPPPPRALTRPIVRPANAAKFASSTHDATTAPPPRVAPTLEEEDGGPQSVRTGWWGGRPATQPDVLKPTAAAPPIQTPSRTLPATAPTSQSRIPIGPPPSQSRIPTAAPPPSQRNIPTAPPSAGRIPAAPPSNPAPPSDRIPAAPPSNPAPQRTSAVMKALDVKRSGSRRNMPAVTSEEVKASAENEFQGALVHFKAFRYSDAAQGFTRASDLLPQSAEYKLYSRWNHILQKGAPMQVGDRGEAWRLALAAIAADPNSAFAHYVAGAVAQEDGQKPIAQRYLSRAVALDPQLMDAQRRLRIVDRREA